MHSDKKKWKCISIEPLKDEWMEKIRKHCEVELSYVSRQDVEKKTVELRAAEVLICRDRDLTIEFLEILKSVKFIFIVSAGVEKLPFEYLKKREITVANSGGISDSAMSDYAIGAMLIFSSRFKECMEYKQQLYWKPYLMTETLKDKKLLIVGTGRVGTAVAKKAKAFEMQITGIKRTPGTVAEFDRVETLENLDSELLDADYVICTLPLTEITYHLFNRERFEKMKKTAIFINISRGKIVDETALEHVLREKKISGAVLDVFETEPLSHDSGFWTLDNVVLTPHSSGRIEEYIKYAVDIFISNMAEFVGGKHLENHINLDIRY